MIDRDRKIEVKYMTIAKALGIIAVVVGHSGSPITDFIYQWHMALFFFISGYFYKDFYTKNPKVFIIKRIKSLYFPYIQYGILFLFLHNILFRLNIYSNKAGSLVKFSHLYTKDEFLQNLLSTFAFGTKEQLLGVFWFLVSLFTVNMLFLIVNIFLEKVYQQNKIVKEQLRFYIILAFFIIGNLSTFFKIHFPRNIDTSLVAISIYYFGYLYHKYEEKIPMNLHYSVIAFVMLLLNSLYGDIRLGVNSFLCPTYFLINSIMGIYIILFTSKYIAVKVKPVIILEYIGRNTLVIISLHFLCFKLINLIQVIYYHLPYYELATFPVIKGSGLWWVVYSLCGVLIPVGLKFIAGKLGSFVKKLKVNIYRHFSHGI